MFWQYLLKEQRSDSKDEHLEALQAMLDAIGTTHIGIATKRFPIGYNLYTTFNGGCVVYHPT